MLSCFIAFALYLMPSYFDKIRLSDFEKYFMFLVSKILSHSSTSITGIFLFSETTFIAREKSPWLEELTSCLVAWAHISIFLVSSLFSSFTNLFVIKTEAKKATFKYVKKVSCNAVNIKRLEICSSLTALA